MVSRRLGRFFTSAGFEVAAVHDPKDVAENLEGVGLLAADAFDGDLVMELVQQRPGLRGILWTAEPLKRSIRYLVDNPAVSNILGRKDFESTPYPWELIMVARRILRPSEAPPSFSAFLDWGFKGYQDKVPTTAGRDEAVEKAQRFIAHLGVPKRIGELFGELSHEMLMNAMYDAPADAQGNAKYAQDRKAILSLPEPEQPTLRLATDGTKLVIQVEDPFGRLQRKHVFAGLARGLAGGEMDTSHGGAGLGMVVCHNATVAMFYEVEQGKKTTATGVFDLDLNLREFRTRAKSLHFFHR
jgi:hypothetical protein